MPGTAPTGSDLAADLPDDLVRRAGGSEVMDRAARKAKLWVISRFRSYGTLAADIDWTDAIITESALARGAYEVYAVMEAEEVARDKKETARELLEGIISDYADTGTSDGTRRTSAGVGASVIVPEAPAWLDHHEGRTKPTIRIP